MSYPLTRLVALTAHPVVRRIGSTRAVLGVLAERAGKDDGTGAFPGVSSIADATGIDRRDVNRLLRALEEAGIITTDGTSDLDTAVRQINVPELAAWVNGRQFQNRDKLPGWGDGGGAVAAVRVRKRGRVGVGQSPMGGSGAEPHGVGVGQNPMGGVGQNPMGGSGAEPHPKHARESRHESTHEPVEPPSVGDLQISTSTHREILGGVGGASLEQVESDATAQTAARTPKPATPKRAPKAQPSFLAEVVESLLPGVAALHGRTFGSPPTARQAQGYRDRIASCVRHHDRSEQAVRARAASMEAVLRWWELPHRDTVPRGVPSCWWNSPTPKALLPVHREQLDDLIGHARTGLEQAERAKSMNTQRNSGSTGVYRQPDHYEDFTGMNKWETWHPSQEAILDAIGPDPAKAQKGGG